MADKNSLLGRSRPSERLSRDEIAALDSATGPLQQRPQPTPWPAKPAKAQKVQVSAKAVSSHWSAPCPACGRKVPGRAFHSPVSAWPGAGAADPNSIWPKLKPR